jgi:pilus assembly protein CpaB
VLGWLAASSVARRESAARRRLGPTVAVVVARRPIDAGVRLRADALGVRRVPARYAPGAAFTRIGELVGLRTAVPVPGGADLVGGMVDDGNGSAGGAPVRSGERIADVVAAGSPELVRAGARVDVVVTRGAATGGGRSQLALENVEVLAASPAPGGARSDDGTPRVAASLRVGVRQAVFLAAAQAFAREIRLLPRAAGDRERSDLGMTVDAGLGH